MSAIKLNVADALAEYIKARVGEFGGNVYSAAADEETEAVFPSCVILPMQFSFTPWQEDELDDSDPEILILSVGDFEGRCAIRVYAKSQDERARLGQRVWDLFFSTEGAPGRLLVDTQPLELQVQGQAPGDTQTLYSARAAFTLEDEEWQEEMVFSKKRYEYLEIGAVIPCVVAREVANIATLTLAITADLDSTEIDEEIKIGQDGSITPYP